MGRKKRLIGAVMELVCICKIINKRLDAEHRIATEHHKDTYFMAGWHPAFKKAIKGVVEIIKRGKW